MAETFPEFTAKLRGLSKGLENPKALMDNVGNKAILIASAAASVDLGGDPKFSGWKPRLDTTFDHIGPGAIVFKPTRFSAGPWTVAQRGRNQGNASGFQGPGVNTRTGLTSRTKSGGVRKVQTKQARRWTGRTAGKHTATDAIAKIKPMVESEFGAYVDDLIQKVG